MPRRIGTRRPRRLFIAEWRERAELTQDQLAAKLGVKGMTVSRWERGLNYPNTNVLSAIADDLGIEPQDLFRHPDTVSVDSLLRGAPDQVRRTAFAMIEGLRRNSD